LRPLWLALNPETPFLGLDGLNDGARSNVNSWEQVASRLLDSTSESPNLEPDNVAHVAGQFMTPHGNQVYPVQMNGRTVFVTIPED
jgi:hypothetical protein